MSKTPVEVLNRWADACPMISPEEAEALDWTDSLKEFREYVQYTLRWHRMFKMLRAHLERTGHTPKQAAARIMCRLGWYPGWTDSGALVKLRAQINAGQLPEQFSMYLNAKSWLEMVRKSKFDDLPSPLPHIPRGYSMTLHEPGTPGYIKAQEMEASRKANKAPALPAADKPPALSSKGKPVAPAIQKQIDMAEEKKTSTASFIERSLEKAKVEISDRECWEWAKRHMGIKGLTVDHAPSTWAHNLYTIAQAGPAKFVSDYYSRWERKKKEDRAAKKKKRHLEDDGRRTIGLVVKLLKEHAERLEKKETGVVVDTKPLTDEDD